VLGVLFRVVLVLEKGILRVHCFTKRADFGEFLVNALFRDGNRIIVILARGKMWWYWTLVGPA
jgi:hypothetical protein